MNKKKHDDAIAEFKKALKTGGLNDNADFKKVIMNVVKNPEMLKDENDSFNFDGEICTANCDGHCCMDIDLVRITPVDVDYMMQSPFLKDKNRAEVVGKCLDLFLGGQSLIPMAKIRFFTPPGTKLNICPFSALMIKASGGKVDDFKNICMLGQAYKPSICMLYPLGRTKLFSDSDSKHDEGWMYFTMQCPGTKTGKQVKIKDFVGNLDVKTVENDYYITFMMDIIKEINEKVKVKNVVRSILCMASTILYTFDKPMAVKLQDVRQAITIHLASIAG